MNSNFFDSFDLNAFLSKYVAGKLLDVATVGFRNALRLINKDRNIIRLEKFNKEDCIECIGQHIQQNIKWASNISFRDAMKAKNISDVFIDLDLYITPLKLRVEPKDNIPKIPISEILCSTNKHIILLGQPGAGKTTSVKKLFLELIAREHESYEVFSFPILIRLKEIVYTKDTLDFLLFRAILNILGIFYSFENGVDDKSKEWILPHIFSDFIERLDVLIILDGFDEVADEKAKNEIIRNLRLIENSLLNSKFILTSRSADYGIHLENSSEYEICPLNENQISEFVNKWIPDAAQSASLLLQLKQSPYWDTTMRPLTLAHLCALYERNNSIPEKPKSVYKKIIHLLLEDWNNQRSIPRRSRYSTFEVDRKIDFLSQFAFQLTAEYGRSYFDKNILQLIYGAICRDFDLPPGDSYHVVNEIESHNGLILQTGTDMFEFAHKSLLEYLVADYLTRLPLLPKSRILSEMPNELAILIAISSKPGVTWFELSYNILKRHSLKREFLRPFLFRLMIEKPDFEPNPFLAITIIYLLNLIAEVVYLLDKRNLVEEEWSAGYPQGRSFLLQAGWGDEDAGEDDDDSPDQKEYYYECANLLLSFRNKPFYADSMRELLKVYTRGEIELGRNNPRAVLKDWGKIALLQRRKDKYTGQSLSVKLPDTLLLVE